MPRAGRGSIRFWADFSALEQAVGAGLAMVETVDDNRYLDDLVTAAYKDTEDVFNTEAIAMGEAGSIRHMFEWGTLGVNKGRTNMRPAPNSERARLWRTVMTGHGLNQTLTFVYKPSLAVVPKPTTRDSGMSQEDISQLADHVFKWKAEVLETGAMVTVVPKNTKFLLIPWAESVNPMFSDRDRERGFTLSKGPHEFSPGELGGSSGNFTAFWIQFWEGRGEQMMELDMEARIKEDFYPAVMSNKQGPLKPVLANSFWTGMKAEEKRIRRNAMARARYHARKKMMT